MQKRHPKQGQGKRQSQQQRKEISIPAELIGRDTTPKRREILLSLNLGTCSIVKSVSKCNQELHKRLHEGCKRNHAYVNHVKQCAQPCTLSPTKTQERTSSRKPALHGEIYSPETKVAAKTTTNEEPRQGHAAGHITGK